MDPKKATDIAMEIDPDLAGRLRFLYEIDQLKSVLRRNLLADASRNENSAEHSWHLAMAAMANDQWQEASVLLQEIEALGLANAETYMLLAQCQAVFSRSRDNTGQIALKRWFEYMERAVRADPTNDAARFRLGTAYCQQRECEEAREYLAGSSGFPGMPQEDQKLLESCRRACSAE